MKRVSKGGGQRRALKQSDCVIFFFHNAFLAVGISVYSLAEAAGFYFLWKMAKATHSELDTWVWSHFSGKLWPKKVATRFLLLLALDLNQMGLSQEVSVFHSSVRLDLSWSQRVV